MSAVLLLCAAEQCAHLVGSFLVADDIDAVIRVGSSPRPGPKGGWRARDSDVGPCWVVPEFDKGHQRSERPVDDRGTCSGPGH